MSDPLAQGRAEPVLVVPYDPGWPDAFVRIRTMLEPVLSDVLLGIEHVGSTAVPGLAAKPVIDVDVVVRDDDAVAEAIARLEDLGYAHVGDLGIAGREALTGGPELPRHHLYVCAAAAEELRRHLAFRDALRADRELAAQYAALKEDLAQRYRDDRDAYSEGKTAFVAGVLRAGRSDQRARKR